MPRQSTRIRFWLKTEIFSFGLAYCPHVSGENDHRKRSPEWKFLKTLASCLHADGRKRRFSNSMMSYIVYSYFEKGCRKKVHATIPKGNMGYDQDTVSDTVAVEPTFTAFL